MSDVSESRVRLEVLKGGSLEDDHMAVTVGPGSATIFATHFKRRDPRHKPLVDFWAGDDFDQSDAMVTPAAAHAEIHRGVHEDLLVHGRPRPTPQDRRASLLRGTLGHIHFSSQ